MDSWNKKGLMEDLGILNEGDALRQTAYDDYSESEKSQENNRQYQNEIPKGVVIPFSSQSDNEPSNNTQTQNDESVKKTNENNSESNENIQISAKEAVREIFDSAVEIMNLISEIKFKLDISEFKHIELVNEDYIIETIEDVNLDLQQLRIKINSFNKKVLYFGNLKNKEDLQTHKNIIESWLERLQLEFKAVNISLRNHHGNGDVKLVAAIEELHKLYWIFRDDIENFLISINKAFNKDINIPEFMDKSAKSLKKEKQ